MPPIAGCNPKLLESSILFCRLAGLVTLSEIIVVMALLGGRPTITQAKLIVSTPSNKLIDRECLGKLLGANQGLFQPHFVGKLVKPRIMSNACLATARDILCKFDPVFALLLVSLQYRGTSLHSIALLCHRKR